ncbi:DNA replication factor Cdt1 [Leptopilina heterotoma]|uniref:DNA replication factor Cdt1 n=1 Tax=Leptopilina heterotoma TaxID=63436 RepID=UPI001CA87131|nr:DNA replication factor Cdt1 [Leptopilina heterotoma]XP_043474202.1 DNA replication factor Cdt1 [Leptopilina heterotoma]
MSQPSVAAYFTTRKRAASEEIRNKSKVLCLDQETRNSSISYDSHRETSTSLTIVPEECSNESLYKNTDVESPSVKSNNSAVRNIIFDLQKPGTPKTPRMNTRTRSRSRKLSSEEGQVDIRESLKKIDGTSSNKNVVFEKKGLLSPKKRSSSSRNLRTPKKNEQDEAPAAGSVTPKKAARIEKTDLSFVEIKNRINQSSRLAEIKERINKIRNCDEKLTQLQAQNERKQLPDHKPQIQRFDKIQLEIPVSPSKAARSPSKLLLSPVKNIQLLKNASPQRRLLFEPKEPTSSPVKGSPTKGPAYQRYQSLAESATPALALPYNYRFLAEVFRCIDTVTAMLFNRNEKITFKKLKPAVQELLRRNLNLDHIAQIKNIYPNAYEFNQEKIRNFGSATKVPTYDLVLTPLVESRNGRNTPDADNVLKSGSEVSMSPGVLLERRRKFYNILLDKVKDEHEEFLKNLETPMVVPRNKLVRWHPEFDIENCKAIEKAELPQPPNVEKASSAKDVLDKAKNLFNCNTRMEKALQRLADAKMTKNSQTSPSKTEKSNTVIQSETNAEGFKKVQISVVDTPPTTPTTTPTSSSSNINPALKGIPKALLERVRAKQAAKALEAMTRSPAADKAAAMHLRLPEIARILRNIFVAEKKSVLTLEFTLQKLDNSYRMKLTQTELEEHIRLLCTVAPAFANIRNVRMIDYLKLVKDIDLAKVIKKLESVANDKLKT